MKYCGRAIIGSKEGMLSAYAIAVMVLSLFNQSSVSSASYYDSSCDSTDLRQPPHKSQSQSQSHQSQSTLTHPFDVLRKFLAVYSTFKWECFVVTINGPVPILHGTHSTQNDTHSKHIQSCLFSPLTQQFKSILESSAGVSTSVGTGVSTNGGTGVSTPAHAEKLTGQGRFLLRACNIQDPIDINNNLGIDRKSVV